MCCAATVKASGANAGGKRAGLRGSRRSRGYGTGGGAFFTLADHGREARHLPADLRRNGMGRRQSLSATHAITPRSCAIGSRTHCGGVSQTKARIAITHTS
jgi:hypothetical protein